MPALVSHLPGKKVAGCYIMWSGCIHNPGAEMLLQPSCGVIGHLIASIMQDYKLEVFAVNDPGLWENGDLVPVKA